MESKGPCQSAQDPPLIMTMQVSVSTAHAHAQAWEKEIGSFQALLTPTHPLLPFSRVGQGNSKRTLTCCSVTKRELFLLCRRLTLPSPL